MDRTDRTVAIGVSALAFAVLLATLTALRAWDLEPTAPVPSIVVAVVGLLVVLSVAVHALRGGDPLDGWLLAFGPALAFAVNAPVPVVAEVTPVVVALPLLAAAVVAGLLAAVGVALARGLDAVTSSPEAGGR